MKGLNLFFLLWKTTLNLKDATNIIKVKKVELIINREKAVATRVEDDENKSNNTQFNNRLSSWIS